MMYVGNFKLGECPGPVGHPKEGAGAVVSSGLLCVVYMTVVSLVAKFVTPLNNELNKSRLRI
jgi:hypothetical protein